MPTANQELPGFIDRNWVDELRQSLGEPLIVHLVSNAVIGDSRVLRSAQISSEAGYPTLIIGISTGPWGLFTVEGIPVLRVPVRKTFRILSPMRLLDFKSYDQWWRWRRGAAALERRARRGDRMARVLLLLSRPLVLSRASAARVLLPRPRSRDQGRWWNQLPALVDHERSFSIALDTLRPAAIHVHSAAPLAAASHAASLSRLRGSTTRVLYHAHDWIPGLAEGNSKRFRAYAAVESEYIGDADIWVAASNEIAQLIEQRHQLPVTPTVVTNAPRVATQPVSPDAPSLRRHIGLSDNDSLLVYSGHVDSSRGVSLAVSSLTELEDVHLALVIRASSPALEAALGLARKLGVADRVHVAPYVSPIDVTTYLSSADVGLIPHDDVPNHNVALPTQFHEYLHAGLPLVTSDNLVMRREIKRHGVGATFRAGDRESLVSTVREVFLDLPGYRGAITEEYLREFSWETQCHVMRGLNERLVSDRLTRPENRAALDALAGPPPEPPAIRYARSSSATSSVGIGPANYAGQATRWAHALAEKYEVEATSFAFRSAFDFPIDFPLAKLHRTDRRAMAEQAAWVMDNYSHLLIDGFRPVLGGLLGGRLDLELSALADQGMRLGLIAHGSDVRDPDLHRARLTQSYFRAGPDDWVDALRVNSARNRALASTSGLPTFVSTPDLLLDLPHARWLPINVEVDLWRTQTAALARKLPRVLHAPSRATPPIKGSHLIEPVLRDLHDRGAIEYVRAERISNVELRKLVQDCDVVVDQILTGSYGVAAVEAMAAGRLVLGFVATDIRALLPEDPPIVDVPDGELRDVMDAILSERQEFTTQAERGPEYAKRWHDGSEAAAILADFVALTDLPLKPRQQA